MQPWRIEGAHPEDRVSGLPLPTEVRGVSGNSDRLDNSRQQQSLSFHMENMKYLF